ncbi:MAG: ATP synthase F1 subunit delta [Lachnospiraceae bacterium]|jgi:F-type H+-transporting ATPase subunit delta|nr:ATP synthase F1 subunit delta [Lachnospiraceae bacterium]MCI9204409.1 ATP synthase F1 subunit delta [Lachnospiraceae bacterium]MCI9334292.1 ATP synthase F1 subunit delta [Lachnospiraceae bacterium]
MAKLVGATYGEALFELAVEEGREEELMNEVILLRELLSENPDFGKLMNHPKVLKEDKLEVLEAVFKGRVSEELVGFLHLIVSKDRYGEIDSILDYFIDEVKQVKGIGVAYVATALDLSEAKKKEVEQKLLSTTSFTRMEMHYQVDESLIGGMVIRIGDRVVDSSIRSKLSGLERELLKVQL